jgi:hypothetical protein
MKEETRTALGRWLWIATIVLVVLIAVQGLSGNWVTLFLALPGATDLAAAFIEAMAGLSVFHAWMGFTIGIFSILVLVLAFLAKSSVYVRVFAVIGVVLAASAILGGYLFFSSGYQDRWALGQMADSFVGAFAAFLLQLFFMNRTPRFPWTAHN